MTRVTNLFRRGAVYYFHRQGQPEDKADAPLVNGMLVGPRLGRDAPLAVAMRRVGAHA